MDRSTIEIICIEYMRKRIYTKGHGSFENQDYLDLQVKFKAPYDFSFNNNKLMITLFFRVILFCKYCKTLYF